MDRVFEFLDVKYDIVDDAQMQKNVKMCMVISHLKMFHFTYNENEEIVLKDINLKC